MRSPRPRQLLLSEQSTITNLGCSLRDNSSICGSVYKRLEQEAEAIREREKVALEEDVATGVPTLHSDQNPQKGPDEELRRGGISYFTTTCDRYCLHGDNRRHQRSASLCRKEHFDESEPPKPVKTPLIEDLMENEDTSQPRSGPGSSIP